MALFSTIRIGLFLLAIVFSIVELGINAYFLSLIAPGYFIFSVLGMATSLLTIITVPIMLIIDSMRRGAFASMIVVELVWLFILWVLWVSTAAEAVTSFNLYFPAGCIYATIDPTANAYCTELQAVVALAFLNFIMFLVYSTVLLVSSIIASGRGKNVWTSSVRESTFFAPNSGPAQYQGYPTQYSGAPGYNGTPVAQPQHFHSYNGQMQPQQMPYPGYGGSPQAAV